MYILNNEIFQLKISKKKSCWECFIWQNANTICNYKSHKSLNGQMSRKQNLAIQMIAYIGLNQIQVILPCEEANNNNNNHKRPMYDKFGETVAAFCVSKNEIEIRI